MSTILYGSYGYTGKLIVKRAQEVGLDLVLAGRNSIKLKAQAKETGYEYKVFDLKDPEALESNMKGFELVIHAAGPFTFTAAQMMDTCLRTGTHYIDITGELDVFDHAAQRSEQAIQKGIMIMPGVGFDVIPTDCLALHLKESLPDANRLNLSFAPLGGGFSRGTAKSMLNKSSQPSFERKDGKLVPVKYGYRQTSYKYKGHEIRSYSIPWGDVYTAYITTGIPNIITYMSLRGAMRYLPMIQNNLRWLLGNSMVRKFLINRIDNLPEGPEENILEKGRTLVYGDASNADGDRLSAAMETPNGYKFSALSSVHIAQKILAGNFKPGFQTPAKCYGSKLVFELPGIHWVEA